MDIISASEALDRNTRQVAALAAALLEGNTPENNDLRKKLVTIVAASGRLFEGETRYIVLCLGTVLADLSDKAAKTGAVSADTALSPEATEALRTLGKLHEELGRSGNEN